MCSPGPETLQKIWGITTSVQLLSVVGAQRHLDRGSWACWHSFVITVYRWNQLPGTGTRIELGQEVGVTVQPLKWRYGPEWSWQKLVTYQSWKKPPNLPLSVPRFDGIQSLVRLWVKLLLGTGDEDTIFLAQFFFASGLSWNHFVDVLLKSRAGISVDRQMLG